MLLIKLLLLLATLTFPSPAPKQSRRPPVDDAPTTYEDPADCQCRIVITPTGKQKVCNSACHAGL